jgi:hypothetical protein
VTIALRLCLLATLLWVSWLALLRCARELWANRFVLCLYRVVPRHLVKLGWLLEMNFGILEFLLSA